MTKEMKADEKLLLCKGFLYGLCFREKADFELVKSVDKFLAVVFPEDNPEIKP